ncbi:MAG: amidase family protein [bacterium]|jgi:aspartyl-tRNA(Asn)/glutamyl-tRNA(Gln) amidotransferase subunit A
MTSLNNLTIHELHELLKNKEIKSADITNYYIEKIKKTDSVINSYISLDSEGAAEEADKADKYIQNMLDNKSKSNNDRGSNYHDGNNKNGDNSFDENAFPYLTGIPLSIKDIFLMKGKKTTCASKILENFISPYDSTVIKRLKENNFIFLGKVNMDEFAMGSSTENSAFKSTKNPWDTKRVPGGSSGGSAASVSADLCAGSFGTDTGGSIRQPASLCGVVGLKPTYGMISRYGIIAFSSSLDQAGPVAKDVLDSAILLEAVSGFDRLDSTSRKFKIKKYSDIVKKADKSKIKGLKIGIPKEFLSEGLDKDILSNIQEIKNNLKELGAEIIEISLPDTAYSIAAYYVIATSEASSNLERYDGIRYGYRFAQNNNNGNTNYIDNNSRKDVNNTGALYNNNNSYTAANNNTGNSNSDSNLDLDLDLDLTNLSGIDIDTSKLKNNLEELYSYSRTIGFGKEVKRRIMLGTFALSAGYYDAYYKKASLIRKLIIKNYKDAFGKVDLIMGPTSPTPAFLIGEKTDDPLSMYLSDIYTISVNLAYLPAMSLPSGLTKENNPNGGGLPIGLQIIAPWCAEDKMLETAKIIEDIVNFRKKFQPDLNI